MQSARVQKRVSEAQKRVDNARLFDSGCWLYPCLLGLHSGIILSEGGIRLIRCLALLHSFEGSHQCRSNFANLLPYGLGFGWSCFGVLRRYYNNFEVGQC